MVMFSCSNNNFIYQNLKYFSFLVILKRYFPCSNLKFKLDANEMVEKLYDIIELNNLIVPTGSLPTNAITWSMISDNLILNEENILISCCLMLRLILMNENDVKSPIDKEIKGDVIKFFKVGYFGLLIL